MRKLNLFLVLLLIFATPARAELENGMAADVVIGQPDLNSRIGGVSQRTFANGDLDVASDGTVLVVSDRGANRVLIWHQIPRRNFVPADVVLGQSDFTTSANGTSQTLLSNAVRGVSVVGGKLFLADRGNDRILIWNTIPTSNFAPADVVVGQSVFNAGGGGLSRTRFNSPEGVFSDGQRMFVFAAGNRRILIWDTVPTTNDAPADVVVGQPDFTTNQGAIVDRKHVAQDDSDMCSDGKALIHADQPNNRVLIWNVIPTENFAPADVVLGQPDFRSNAVNQGGGPNASTMRQPIGCAYDGRRLFVADINNNRVLIWNSLPTKNNTPADFVLGQPNFNVTTDGAGPRKMRGPHSVILAGRQLLVADDGGNNRILIFNLAESNLSDDLGPQFSQGKAVVGKVFWDFDGDGRQDA